MQCWPLQEHEDGLWYHLLWHFGITYSEPFNHLLVRLSKNSGDYAGSTFASSCPWLKQSCEDYVRYNPGAFSSSAPAVWVLHYAAASNNSPGNAFWNIKRLEPWPLKFFHLCRPCRRSGCLSKDWCCSTRRLLGIQFCWAPPASDWPKAFPHRPFSQQISTDHLLFWGGSFHISMELYTSVNQYECKKTYTVHVTFTK